ncbi:MAG: glycosyltransferase family 2 protein, partial [Acidobacteriaceae bacterium]|nr:glycosyltransferase family 2 protein [Acidobacteriaceae bacterium]
MPELSVIVPTYNERANLVALTTQLDAALVDIDYEIVIVDDDSPDGTSALARTLAQQNRRVRVIQRIGRRGLSSATVEGMLSTSSPYLAVIDGDLQHDETKLPEMLRTVKRDNLDLVIGSRHIEGGSMGDFAKHRRALSQFGRRLSSLVCRADVSDPMSGFFVLSRSYVHEVAHSLSSTGFKILLDLIASSRRPVRFAEVGYTFRNRLHGTSKLDILVGLEYLQLLLDKAIGGWMPVSYLIFSMVGTIGLVANVLLIYAVQSFLPVSFTMAQAIGSVLVIGLNFLLNNQLTFRSARLKGWRAVQGFIVFYIACGVGLAFNLMAAKGFRDYGLPWYWASS